jgi:zinc transport system ATP-binding protein
MKQVPAVCIQNMSFRYDGPFVLKDVDLDIAAGDFVSIIGPNGSGKTTLLKLMLGLLQPQHGKIRLFGRPVARARHRIGYMPQLARLDPDFPVTVMDVVLTGRLGRRLPVGPFLARDRQAAEHALADTEALEIRDRPFASLSGGQRQKVLIARALTCDPDILMLDEPTASLDPGVQDELYELLSRLNEKMTVILVSHDVNVVYRHVNKVVCVNVNVVEHPATEITGELKKLFPGHLGMRLVRHDHTAGGADHDHPSAESGTGE